MEDEITIDTLRLTAENVKKQTTDGKLLRIPPRLYQAHPDVYTPLFVSVGPFHHTGQNFNRFKDVNILAMEARKRVYMLDLLNRTVSCDETLETCWAFMRENLNKIWSCYCEEIDISPELLAKIILVDGCFLVSFFLHNYRDVVTLTLRRDLALLENQVPFFVIESLFHIIKSKSKFTSLQSIEGKILELYQLTPEIPQLRNDAILGCTHLLDFISKSYHPTPIADNSRVYIRFSPWSKGICLRNATKLRDNGVTFRNGGKDNLLDLKFLNGMLLIPTLVINDCTETLLTNLLAHEHLSPNSKEYFTSYVIFMTHLIESKNDLRILEQQGIILNLLGNRDDASKIFSKFSKQFVLKHFFFGDLCYEIEEYATSWWRWQRYIQIFKLRYFSSLWTALSLFAATLLLTFTLLQTIYTILSYYQAKSPSM